MKLLSVFSLLFVLFACVKNNPDPSWVQIKAWTLEANASLNGEEGSLSHNFTHAWVYADGQLIGVFELPVKIPILDEGSSELKIFPVIEDNGIGIDNKHLDKIFGMFYRATKFSKGSGMGLYIVKETIDKLKGSITVESRLNEGSKFTVSLPNLN